MGGAAGAAAVPAGRGRAAAVVGLRRGQPGRVRRLRADRAAGRGAVDRRGLPRRPRDAADRRATPAEIAARAAARGARARSACRSRSASPRTKLLAKVASGVAKPDGLLVVPPGGERAFLHPLRGRAAVGRRPGDRAAAARPRASPPSASSRALGEATLVIAARAAGRAGSSTRWPTTATRGPCGRGARPPLVRGRSARWAAVAAIAGGASTRCSSGSSTASRAGCATAGRAGRTVVLRLRFDDFSRATRVAHAARTRRRPPGRSSPPRALLAAARPTIDRRGLTLVGVARDRTSSATAAPSSSCCRSTVRAAARSTPCSTTCASASDPPPVTRAALLGRDRLAPRLGPE